MVSVSPPGGGSLSKHLFKLKSIDNILHSLFLPLCPLIFPFIYFHSALVFWFLEASWKLTCFHGNSSKKESERGVRVWSNLSF